MAIHMPPIRLPKSQRAIKVSVDGVATTSEGDLPQVGDEEVLVRVVCVALNPVDSKSVEMSPTHGATVGCDFAGEVVQMGKAVSTVTLGARVCGCVFGNNPMRPDNGAFAEYVAVPSRLVLVVPPTMSYQSAATLGVGLATVGLALYQAMRLKCTPSAPAKKGFPVLVSGAGTATGALATQILTLSGLQPIVTSSPGSFDRLRRLGAVATFDYQSPTCASDIREYTANELGCALDCHVDSGSMTICYNAIGSDGGRYVALNPFPLRLHRRRSVQPGWVFMFTQFDQTIPWKRPYYRDERPQDYRFATGWYEEMQELLEAGTLVPSPYIEQTGGLDAIVRGLEAMGRGEIRGRKWVYAIGKE
ncbi:enoyl reductase LovC [Aspergillus lentulus]|uniref:Enoyl reductase LovC n=1 Tax=Aspergillus lentulus TaxID=293939 RepID=A0ABQ0ZSF7_ASPLE|nr:enoyl reductase LovC [Aspergillus lentulus]